MNAPDLLDLALGKTDDGAPDTPDRDTASDPLLADRLDRIGRGLRLMLDDDPARFEPPAGLASRTIAFVQQEARRRADVIEFVPRARRFRFEDLAVAATIFLASMLALAPAVLRGRERWGRAGCAHNLQQVGLRLNQYAALNETYPFVSAEDEVPHVGSIVCRLSEGGFPIEPEELHCPCSGSVCDKSKKIPALAAVREALKRSADEGCRMLENDFAFHVGYRPRPDHEPAPLPAYLSATTPILADSPPHDASRAILLGNSPNHAGRGQNVLFADGHVEWSDDRRVSPIDKDLYLNNDDQPTYGIGPADAVLMPSVFRIKSR